MILLRLFTLLLLDRHTVDVVCVVVLISFEALLDQGLYGCLMLILLDLLCLLLDQRAREASRGL